jgi:DMSO/TMAO reductase YedYZ molybdopterin-dependent catalytic subunit
MEKIIQRSLSAVLMLLTVIGLSACGNASPTSSNAAVSELPSVEIKEYNGHKLSPVSDVKDASISGPQKVDITSYRLKISGLVESPAEFSYDEVLKYPNYTKEVVLNCVIGWSADELWQGVLISDLLDKAKVKPEANTIIFHAVDGYTTSLPLQTVIEKKMIIAYKVNGVVLPEETGFPFILVAEDKLGYKWIKWLGEIELSSDSSYQGYWESRGYSNEGDVTN